VREETQGEPQCERLSLSSRPASVVFRRCAREEYVMKRENVALAGVLGATGALGTAALAASGCPVLAVLFSVFGVSLGALANLTAVYAYRAILVAAGLVSLLSAAWWIYGRRAQLADAPPPSSRGRVLFWVAAGVFAIAAAYPYASAAYKLVACG
jgi:hypothetical protein